MKERMRIDPHGKGCGEELGRVKTIIRIYYVIKQSIFNKRKGKESIREVPFRLSFPAEFTR